MSNKKEKTSASPRLVWSSEYAFVSSYSMDECITHLNALNAKYQKDRLSFWESNRFDVDGLTDNGGVVQFEIEGSATKQIIKVRSMGQLIYKDHHRTLVRMLIGITRRSIIEDLTITSAICVLFILAYHSVAGLVSVISMSIILLLITYVVFLSLRSNIRASVYEALSIKPAPRPTTLPR